MESNITILATDKEFKEFFDNEHSDKYIVKLCEFIDKDKVSSNNLDMSDPNRYCWKVLLRHRELKEELKGVFTVDGILKRIAKVKYYVTT
jgi:hypothetical protein